MFTSAHSDLTFPPSQGSMDSSTIEPLQGELDAQAAAANGGLAARLDLQRKWFTDPASAQLECAILLLLRYLF